MPIQHRNQFTLFKSYRFRLVAVTPVPEPIDAKRDQVRGHRREISLSSIVSTPDGLLLSRPHAPERERLVEQVGEASRLVLYSLIPARGEAPNHVPARVVAFHLNVGSSVDLPLAFDACVDEYAMDRLLFRRAELTARYFDVQGVDFENDEDLAKL